MDFGEKLSAARKAKGFSQEELAAKIEVSRQAISKWETGSAQPDTANIIVKGLHRPGIPAKLVAISGDLVDTNMGILLCDSLGIVIMVAQVDDMVGFDPVDAVSHEAHTGMRIR